MKTYRIDRKEEAIAEVQRYLRAISYAEKVIPHIAVDGIYGKETKEAVRAFQILLSLAQTGVVDDETFAALYRRYLEVPYRKEG